VPLGPGRIHSSVPSSSQITITPDDGEEGRALTNTPAATSGSQQQLTTAIHPPNVPFSGFLLTREHQHITPQRLEAQPILADCQPHFLPLALPTLNLQQGQALALALPTLHGGAQRGGATWRFTR